MPGLLFDRSFGCNYSIPKFTVYFPVRRPGGPRAGLYHRPARPLALQILRELGSKSVQAALNFRFKPDSSAQEQVRRFAEEVRSARAAKGTLTSALTVEQLKQGLLDRGFIAQLRGS